MDELVKRIDPHFVYERYETEGGIMRIYVRSTRGNAQCPYYSLFSVSSLSESRCLDTPASSYWQKQPKADDLPGRLHDASTKRRTAAVEKVRELAGQGLSMDQISEATGYCRATVKIFNARF